MLLSNEDKAEKYFFLNFSLTSIQNFFAKPLIFRETAKLVEEPGELTGRAAVYGMAQKIPQ